MCDGISGEDRKKATEEIVEVTNGWEFSRSNDRHHITDWGSSENIKYNKLQKFNTQAYYVETMENQR